MQRSLFTLDLSREAAGETGYIVHQVLQQAETGAAAFSSNLMG